MNEKRNIVSVIFFAVWAALLAVLMIRLPIADIFTGVGLLTVDIVLSAIFCVIGIAAAFAGYFLSSKVLVLMSALSGAMQIISVICFMLYVLFFNRDVLAFALYFANPFCAILSTPGFIILALYIGFSALLPVLAFVFLRRNEHMKEKRETTLKEQEIMEK